MSRRFTFSACFVFCGAWCAFGQSDAPKPAFDIADVHLSPREQWAKTQVNAMMGGYLSGDRYEVRRATMLDLIHLAYDIPADKVFGGPSWLDYDRFEIAAKTKPGTKPEALRLMLQALLADRFGLVVKPDTQPVPGYTLSKGKGELKLKQSAGGGNPGCQNSTRIQMGSSEPPQRNIRCHDVNMDSFAMTLAGTVSNGAVRYSVVNSTAIEGKWDIEMQFPDQPGILAQELSKAGLTFELGKVPQPVVTVEKVNEKPSPNAPGLEAAFPARPQPEFEAASVRLSGNEGGGSRAIRFEAGGRVTASGMAPSILIEQAWNLPSYELIAGLPKSFSGSVTKNITITAKAPEGWFPDIANVATLQARDMLYQMLRSLLIERYQMKWHFEERPADALTLTANKPKLTKADPAGRTGCRRESQQQEGRSLIVKLACRNITMAQFAEQIPALDFGVLYPVEDGTGLEGAWDFTLTYDAMSRLAGFRVGPAAAAPPADGGATGQAEDPSGSVSFLEAVQKQLGLKLETHKRPERVLVIDQMREDPLEN
jgi:uncharacterized protein (TIGR03435 family)